MHLGFPVAEPAVPSEVVEMARRIVGRKVDPYRGAAGIWAYLAERGLGYPEDLRIFVGLASEWQDDPAHRSALEIDIREEARNLLARIDERDVCETQGITPTTALSGVRSSHLFSNRRRLRLTAACGGSPRRASMARLTEPT